MALGDSFTEGLDDPSADGNYCGWADRFAAKMSANNPEFRYANLAIRGRCIAPIVDEQVPVAIAMNPDLVSLAGGINDALRPKFSMEATANELETAVIALRASGADVMLWAFGDPSRRSTTLGTIKNRMRDFREITIAIAADHDCYVVDLWPERLYDDSRVWAEDRLHLNALGHERTACAAMEVLGLGDHEWAALLEDPHPMKPIERARGHLEWTGKHLAPWIGRRINRRSSGDGIVPKRDRLEPVDYLVS